MVPCAFALFGGTLPFCGLRRFSGVPLRTARLQDNRWRALGIVCGMWQYEERMEYWRTVRPLVTLVLLLLAGAEIFACDAIASPECLFSSHATPDSGDGCLCCCAHIVVVQPIVPLGPLASVGETIVVSDSKTPDVPPSRIEHPPRS